MVDLDERWTFTRNKSWRQSARIGLVHGVWWFPTSLHREIAAILRGLRDASEGVLWYLLALLLATLYVAGCHLVFLLFGLAGFIAEQEPSEPAQLPTE